MALNQLSKRTIVLLSAVCAICGFMAGSSSSQQNKPAAPPAEVGRYQATNFGGRWFVFDTKTARFWEEDSRNLENLSGIETRWKVMLGPLDPQPQVQKNQPPIP